MSGYEIEVANLQEDLAIDETMVSKIVSFVLSEENIEDAVISVALVDEGEITRLNREFRGLDEATDVLSFLYENDPKLFGEIVIAPAYVKDQAQRFGVSFEREFIMVLIHGMLHLLGYDHEIKTEEAELMWKRQKELEKKYLQQHNTF
jgi:probable rRNA maturation factor